MRFVGQDGGAEIYVARAISAAEVESTTQWLKQNLRETMEKRPDTRAEVLVVAEQGSEVDAEVSAAARKIANGGAENGVRVDVDNAKLPANWSEAKQKKPSWFSRHYGIVFSLIRGVLNGGATWGLMISAQLPWEAAVVTGGLVGTIGFVLQKYNKKFGDWVSRGSRLYSFFKWYMTEVVFLALIDLTKYGVSAWASSPIPFEGMAGHAAGILQTALMTLASQGLWDVGVARNANRRYREARVPPEKIETDRDWVTLLVSVFAVGSAVAASNDATQTLGHIGFGLIAVTGAFHYVQTLYLERKASRCGSMLESAKPQGSDDDLLASRAAFGLPQAA